MDTSTPKNPPFCHEIYLRCQYLSNVISTLKKYFFAKIEKEIYFVIKNERVSHLFHLYPPPFWIIIVRRIKGKIRIVIYATMDKQSGPVLDTGQQLSTICGLELCNRGIVFFWFNPIVTAFCCSAVNHNQHESRRCSQVTLFRHGKFPKQD